MSGWTPWYARLIALAAVLVSAGRLQGQEPTPEQQVWAAVIQARGDGVVLEERTSSQWMSGVPRDVPADAWASFLEANREPVALRDHLLPHPSVRFESDVPDAAEGDCRSRRTLLLSRVGFSADGTLAVVSVGGAVGAGPYPGCGYAWSDTVLMRRSADGTWRTVRMLGGFIT